MVRVSPVSLGGVVVRQSVPPVVETSELEDNTELHCSLLTAQCVNRAPAANSESDVCSHVDRGLNTPRLY